MYSFNKLTKRERYYLNRKKRLDEKFVWTPGKILSLRELNVSLSLMQERIVEGVKKVSAVFSRLEADGMDFLPLSKVRMEQKFKSWWLDFPDDTDFELCNYLL